MARFAELTKVSNQVSRRDADDDFSHTDDTNEPQQARAEGTAEAAVPGNKVIINLDTIRCFYPRNENRPGTRITFADGGGFPVEEDYATLKALVMPN